jgi:hypothetical protein
MVDIWHSRAKMITSYGTVKNKINIGDKKMYLGTKNVNFSRIEMSVDQKYYVTCHEEKTRSQTATKLWNELEEMHKELECLEMHKYCYKNFEDEYSSLQEKCDKKYEEYVQEL